MSKCVSLKEEEYKKETDEKSESSSVEMCQPKRGKKVECNKEEVSWQDVIVSRHTHTPAARN